MSTRATIKIKDGSEVRWLYHHSDGYPDGVGKELEGILSDEKYWTLPSIFTRLTKNLQYEPTDGIHGDEEYGYLIDCIDRKLVGYSIYMCGDGASEDWTNEVFRKEYSECEKKEKIPFLLKDCFLCEFCRKICSGECFEQLSKINSGEWKPGDKEYEENKDLIGRKQIITCLGPYCDRPCKYQQLDFMPYNDSDGVKALVGTIRYLGEKVNELISEKNARS